MKVGDEVYFKGDEGLKGRVLSHNVLWTNGDYDAYRDEDLTIASECEKEKMKDGWVEWTGGEIPVYGSTRVAVRWKSGEIMTNRASKFVWSRNGFADDVAAYKILDEEPKGHPNASILMEIAKEAAINPEYWKEYEVKFYDEEMTIEWVVCRNESDLFYGLQNDINIRRKPRTIRIGNYDVPEPSEISIKQFDNSSSVLIDFDCVENARSMLKALQELLAVKK